MHTFTSLNSAETSTCSRADQLADFRLYSLASQRDSDCKTTAHGDRSGQAFQLVHETTAPGGRSCSQIRQHVVSGSILVSHAHIHAHNFIPLFCIPCFTDSLTNVGCWILKVTVLTHMQYVVNAVYWAHLLLQVHVHFVHKIFWESLAFYTVHICAAGLCVWLCMGM